MKLQPITERSRCRKCNKRRYKKYLWWILNIEKNKIEFECYNCELDNRGRKPDFNLTNIKGNDY